MGGADLLSACVLAHKGRSHKVEVAPLQMRDGHVAHAMKVLQERDDASIHHGHGAALRLFRAMAQVCIL